MKAKIYFLPLLLLYLAIILLAYNNNLENDELRYAQFAYNLSQGYYSPPDHINLWNGPGYPLLLTPFAFSKSGWLPARVMNAFLLFFAVIYFFRTLKTYLNEKVAFYISYILGIYPPVLRDLPSLLTEIFVFFLICGFIYHFSQLMQNDEKNILQLIISSFYLALIALTKIIFGYVILIIMAMSFIGYVLFRKINILKLLSVSLIAMFFCFPYLFYTYSLTGKMFYWGNSGGMSLYWMSTPYSGELGNWYNRSQVYSDPQLYANHHVFFDRVAKLDSVRQDEEFKKQGLKNMRAHPLKYLYNWLCNVGRMLFSYPFSYKLQSPNALFYIIPNMFLVVLSILCIYPTVKSYRNIPSEIIALILISFIYLGSSSLLSAYGRQLCPVLPILFLWISFTLFRLIEIRICTFD